MQMRAVAPLAVLIAILAVGGSMVYQRSLASQLTVPAPMALPEANTSPVVSTKVPTVPPPYSFELPPTPEKPLVATKPLPEVKNP